MDNLIGYTQVALELDENKEIKTIYERGDALLSIQTDGQTKIYLSDGHGDVRYLTDEEGNITDFYRYSAYGELVEKVGTTENPYLYCGEYYDEGTGLYYLRARYMNTTTGTFISMDSYQGNTYDPASLHKYTYAQNNPQMYNDPSGHFVGMISTMTSVACNSIMSNLRTLNVMGMVGGFMNVAINQVFGTGENIGYAFWEGYATGFGMGMVYIGAAAIAAFFEVQVLFHLGMFSIAYFEAAKNITFAIACYSTGADKEALVYSVFAVLCVVTMCGELGISAKIAVTGKRGTTGINVTSNSHKVLKGTHGNSKTSTKPQHGYEIYNKKTGDVVKTGISGQKLNANGTTPRANVQVNKLNKAVGEDIYDARIVVENLPNRAEALEWELNNALRLWEEGNSMSIHKRPTPWR